MSENTNWIEQLTEKQRKGLDEIFIKFERHRISLGSFANQIRDKVKEIEKDFLTQKANGIRDKKFLKEQFLIMNLEYTLNKIADQIAPKVRDVPSTRPKDGTPERSSVRGTKIDGGKKQQRL